MNIEKLGKKLSIDTKNAILLNSSIILLLSKHESFKDNYKDHREDAAQFLHESINDYLPENIIPYFNFIDDITSDEDLHDIILKIEKEDIPYDKDLVSDFSKDEKKSLGIVLTPEHIADLMAKIINVSEDDILLDTCSGTGRLAMTQKETKNIICIEQQPYMYALLTLNALMHDIDTDNIILGSCFDYESEDGRKPTKCIINPPYGLDKGLTELDFMINALNNMEVGGKLAAIVPTSTAIDCKKSKLALRKELLESHTLEAVMKMPLELFKGSADSQTVIMVFTAGIKHSDRKETWLADWSNDGFIWSRTQGRIPGPNWEDIHEQWLCEYENKKEIPEHSLCQHVGPEDEWLYEAYIDTDYNKLTKEDFEETLFNYKLFNENGKLTAKPNKLYSLIKSGFFNKNEPFNDSHTPELNTDSWKEFKITDLFDMTRGKRLKSEDRESGDIPYYSASDSNNGLTDMISNPLFIEKDALIYTTFGDCYYVEGEFTASDEVTILKNKNINKYSGIFMSVVLSQNKFRFSFGRKAFMERIKQLTIKLPATPEGEPDYQFMEDYIKTLPYSKNI